MASGCRLRARVYGLALPSLSKSGAGQQESGNYKFKLGLLDYFEGTFFKVGG